MLRGMGWQEGKGIKGRDPVKPIEYVPRPRGLGLGAKAALEAPSETRILRQGETRDPRDQMARKMGGGSARTPCPSSLPFVLLVCVR